MNAREERGLVIAALCKLNRDEASWLVPSQSGDKIYRVDPKSQTCECPDHQERGCKCKHIYAVEFTIKRETDQNGNIIETRSMTFTEKVTIKRDWSAYNEAQQTEKKRFLKLLFELTRGVPNVARKGNIRGRRPMPMRDMIFCSALKVFTTQSSRRFACDLEDAFNLGYLSVHMNSLSVNHYLENDMMTPILQTLVEHSALPLRSVETVFAPDSTGFSTSRFVRWYDEKYGITRSGHDWVKAHAMCGTKTHVITAVEIHNRDAADCPMFAPLVETTARNFTIKEVCADKAYLSHDNLDLVDSKGAVPYIPFKVNSIAGEAGRVWEKMFLYYQLNKEDFERHYHQRSNAESVFSMVKAKFGDGVRSRTDVAMKNETLCKFLCHNICCVIMSQVELGIEAVFWKNE